MKANKIKYSCPFCGSECERKFVTVVLNAGYVEYKCTNDICNAIISFDNMTCNLNPQISDRYFMNRYLGGDNHD